MKTLLSSLLVVGGSSCFGPNLMHAAPTNARPNIIVFYTDDHGHADIGIQGVVKDIKTPHIDALARSGVLANTARDGDGVWTRSELQSASKPKGNSRKLGKTP